MPAAVGDQIRGNTVSKCAQSVEVRKEGFMTASFLFAGPAHRSGPHDCGQDEATQMIREYYPDVLNKIAMKNL